MTDPAAPRRVRVVVHGRVQGVFFRGSTEEAAVRAGVAGWVRNRADGAVEAVFEGDPKAVARMIDFVHRGPRWARVDRVEVVEEPPEGLDDFGVRR
jgi:acylphosphatase